jgi:C1A family cysteine protease
MKYLYSYNRDKSDKRDLQFANSISPHPEIKLPKYVDLRNKCPSIYDQGDLGSCTANAGCTCRAMLLNNPEVNLSRLFLYYIERGMEGNIRKDTGASLRDTCKSIYKIGVCEEKFMPYDAENFSQHPSRSALSNASKYKILAYKSLNTLDEIKQNLVFRQQPVLIGMDIYESFETKEVAKTGIMTMPRKEEKGLGGHAVLVVGYKETTRTYGFLNQHKVKNGHLIVRNSWGENWGDKGYFYMPYEYVRPEYTYDYWIME